MPKIDKLLERNQLLIYGKINVNTGPSQYISVKGIPVGQISNIISGETFDFMGSTFDDIQTLMAAVEDLTYKISPDSNWSKWFRGKITEYGIIQFDVPSKWKQIHKRRLVFDFALFNPISGKAKDAITDLQHLALPSKDNMFGSEMFSKYTPPSPVTVYYLVNFKIYLKITGYIVNLNINYGAEQMIEKDISYVPITMEIEEIKFPHRENTYPQKSSYTFTEHNYVEKHTIKISPQDELYELDDLGESEG